MPCSFFDKIMLFGLTGSKRKWTVNLFFLHSRTLITHMVSFLMTKTSLTDMIRSYCQGCHHLSVSNYKRIIYI